MPDPENLLPLSPAVFHILLAIGDGEKHGYAIMKEIADSSGMNMGPGTLYGSIKRMLAAGIIEETDERSDPALNDERRRYYRLTPFGRRVGQAEAARLANSLRIAQLKRLWQDGI